LCPERFGTRGFQPFNYELVKLLVGCETRIGSLVERFLAGLRLRNAVAEFLSPLLRGQRGKAAVMGVDGHRGQ
jgi:hypothetical protein